AAEGGFRVAHAAQHLHGGIGVDTEYPLFRYFRWTRQIELTLGGAALHLVKLGDRIAARACGRRGADRRASPYQRGKMPRTGARPCGTVARDRGDGVLRRDPVAPRSALAISTRQGPGDSTLGIGRRMRRRLVARGTDRTRRNGIRS